MITTKKRPRDDSSADENSDAPEWEEVNLEQWEQKTGVNIHSSRLPNVCQKKLKTVEVEFDVRVIEDIDFKVCIVLRQM